MGWNRLEKPDHFKKFDRRLKRGKNFVGRKKRMAENKNQTCLNCLREASVS